jgi:hypothetical protein
VTVTAVWWDAGRPSLVGQRLGDYWSDRCGRRQPTVTRRFAEPDPSLRLGAISGTAMAERVAGYVSAC